MAPTVTLQTIADAVGVSRTTVSNAYSRPDQLSDELRERIFQTAARLGYRGPNPAGRLLRSGRAGAIGVVLTESLAWAFADPYAVEFLAATAGVAESARHALLLVPCPPGEDQREGIPRVSARGPIHRAGAEKAPPPENDEPTGRRGASLGSHTCAAGGTTIRPPLLLIFPANERGEAGSLPLPPQEQPNRETLPCKD